MAILGIFSVIIAGLICSLPVIVIALIVTLVVKKSKDTEKVDIFNKIVKTVYTYIVLIGFLLATIISGVSAFNSLVDYYFPNEEINSDYEEGNIGESKEEKDIRELQYKQEIKNSKNNSITNFAEGITIFIISLPMFIYHSKISRKIDQQ